MVADSLGGAYVGNLGWDDERDDKIHDTILIYVGVNRAPKIVADGLVNPNGMVLSADDRTLLVNETFAARTTAFDVAPDGSLRNRRVWADYAGENFSRVSEALASGAILPDGIALDRDGAAWGWRLPWVWGGAGCRRRRGTRLRLNRQTRRVRGRTRERRR